MDTTAIFQLIGSYTFPIIVSIYLLTQQRTQLNTLTTAIENNTQVLKNLIRERDEM